jgi:dipeptidyl aminopeptidase/acylaminoacyl peptidase
MLDHSYNPELALKVVVKLVGGPHQSVASFAGLWEFRVVADTIVHG